MKFQRVLPNLRVYYGDWKIYLSVIIYRLLLDVVYVRFVYPKFAYYNFGYSPGFSYSLISIFLLVPIVLWVPVLMRRGRLSDLIVLFLILMYYVPFTSLYAQYYHNSLYTLFVFIYFMLLVAFDLSFSIDGLKIKRNHKGFGETKAFVFIVVFLGLILIAISGIYTGFRISLDLSDYYEYRAAARENAMPEIVRYLFNWSSLGLTVGLAYSLIKKKRILSIYIVICTVLSFSYNGKKSVLFTLFLTIIIALFYKETYKQLIPWAFSGISLLSVIEIIINNGDSFIARHFIRRMLFIPPMMGTLYYDYFSTHELDYLRSSVLRRFGVVSPYTHIPRFIGSVYFHNDTLAMNANTGLCGDAYANFGFWSLLFVPFVIIFTFKIVEWCSKNVNYRIRMIVAFSLAYSFVSGAYFTLLLTNGVIFISFMLAFLNPSYIYSDNALQKSRK